MGFLDHLRRDLVELVRCFMCGNLTPPKPDPVCTKCLRELEDWDKVVGS